MATGYPMIKQKMVLNASDSMSTRSCSGPKDMSAEQVSGPRRDAKMIAQPSRVCDGVRPPRFISGFTRTP